MGLNFHIRTGKKPKPKQIQGQPTHKSPGFFSNLISTFLGKLFFYVLLIVILVFFLDQIIWLIGYIINRVLSLL